MNAAEILNKGLKPGLAAATLALAAANAWAVDTSAWVCEYCPFESGTDGNVLVGASTVSDDSAYFGNATGYGESGVYADLDSVGSAANDSQQLQWQAYDLGLDSRSGVLSGGNQGSYDYDLAFWQIPREQYYTTDTIFSESGDALMLPSGWVRAPVTSGFTQLAADLAGRDISSERKVWEIGGAYLPSSRFTLSANFQNQKNDGLNIYGGSFFTQSSLLPGRFDYETNLVDLGVSYALDSGHIALDYYLSDFSSGNNQVRWENPFTSAAGAEFGALAQPPDNKFHQVSLSGSYRFHDDQTVASILVASGRMTQDDAFLPYTTNPNLMPDPLPASNLDGQIDTTNFAFTLTSRAIDKTILNFAYRYNDRDNKSPQWMWNRVIADTFVSNQPEANLPYSFKGSEFNVSADYDLFKTIRISAGYDWGELDRTLQEVDNQTEEGGWGAFRWRPSGLFQLSVKGGTLETDPGSFNQMVSDSFGQNPLMRPYNMAYRYRRYAELTASGSLPESPVSMTLSSLWADDNFSQTQIGVTQGDDFRVALDVNWMMSENGSLYVTGGYENMEIDQAGSENFSSPDWFATNEDDFYTYGLGFRLNDIAGKLDLQVDYTRSDGSSDIGLTSASGGNSQFPDLKSKIDSFWVRLGYQHSSRLEYSMRVGYQSISSDDWALNGVGPATIPVVLSLGADPYDDNQWIVGLNLRYSLGKTED